jgi:DNA-binding transcriptional LysR family regulator
MLAGIDTTRLRVFREVVERGSFTAAAVALNISQPAVSQHVAKLEQETGCALLERSSRRVRLTQAGEVYLGHVQSLLAGLDEAHRELAALAGAATGQLRMAAFPSAAATVVPPVIGAFHQNMPKVRIGLHEADPPVSLPKLIAGDLDLVLAYDYPMLGVPRDPRVVWQVVALDAMAAALPTGHPLSAQDRIGLAQLAGQRWAAPHHAVCRDALELACRKAGFQPDIVAETNDYTAMLGMVASGVGVAVVPRLLTSGTLPGGVVLRPLDGTRLVRTLAVVRRVAGDQTPAMRKMCELLCSHLADHIQPDLSVRLPEQVA